MSNSSRKVTRRLGPAFSRDRSRAGGCRLRAGRGAGGAGQDTAVDDRQRLHPAAARDGDVSAAARTLRAGASRRRHACRDQHGRPRATACARWIACRSSFAATRTSSARCRCSIPMPVFAAMPADGPLIDYRPRARRRRCAGCLRLHLAGDRGSRRRHRSATADRASRSHPCTDAAGGRAGRLARRGARIETEPVDLSQTLPAAGWSSISAAAALRRRLCSRAFPSSCWSRMSSSI